MRNAIAFAFALAMTSNAPAASLAVRIEGLREAKGHLMLSVSDSAEAWDGKAAARTRLRRPVSASSETIRFDDLPPGSYAVQVFHDANDNGRMDTNVVGMPVEGYGFSRNPLVMRKATYDEARFELAPDGGEIVIELR